MDNDKKAAPIDDRIIDYEQWLRDNPFAPPESTAEIRRRLRELNYEKAIYKIQDHDNNSN